MQIMSFSAFGYEGEVIKVEVDLRRGLPVVDIVGLPGSAVKEAKERIRAAIRNAALPFPQERILINLSPADLKKEGSAFDLPIALAVLRAQVHASSAEETPELTGGARGCAREVRRVMVLGELELSGRIRPVRGTLAAVAAGLSAHIYDYIVPNENEAEARITPGVRVFAVQELRAALVACQQLAVEPQDAPHEQSAPGWGQSNSVLLWEGKQVSVEDTAHRVHLPADTGASVHQDAGMDAGAIMALFPKRCPGAVGETGARPEGTAPGVSPFLFSVGRSTGDASDSAGGTGQERPVQHWPHAALGVTGGFEDVRGQRKLIRALQIAAAGGHHLIAYGAPGCGKTLSLSRFALLLPDLDARTALEVTRVHSIAGLLPKGAEQDPLMRRPPCRTPHSSASAEGIIGGAGTCLPGEISLAHGGVLFLDEATQFKRPVLETLRTPLETGQITVSRAGKSSTYPARFQLLLAVNPCACGNFGVQHKVCTCAPQAVERYWRKLTAPLLDRVDLRVEVLPPASHTLLSEPACCTARLRKTVACALEAQWERQGSCLCAPINGRSSTVEDWIRYRNARLSPENVQRWCMLTDDAAREFHRAVGKEQLSGRGGHAVLKIARTIADIEGVARLQVAHVQEAVALRTWSALLPHSLT